MDAWAERQQREHNMRSFWWPEPPRRLPPPRFTERQLEIASAALGIQDALQGQEAGK